MIENVFGKKKSSSVSLIEMNGAREEERVEQIKDKNRESVRLFVCV